MALDRLPSCKLLWMCSTSIFQSGGRQLLERLHKFVCQQVHVRFCSPPILICPLKRADTSVPCNENKKHCKAGSNQERYIDLCQRWFYNSHDRAPILSHSALQKHALCSMKVVCAPPMCITMQRQQWLDQAVKGISSELLAPRLKGCTY